ncbi:MAG: hypothetical protein OXG39_12215 [Chloroflexi bacterium]|nr:hypothetical protein [Chloroflexota bacterium]
MAGVAPTVGELGHDDGHDHREARQPRVVVDAGAKAISRAGGVELEREPVLTGQRNEG